MYTFSLFLLLHWSKLALICILSLHAHYLFIFFCFNTYFARLFVCLLGYACFPFVFTMYAKIMSLDLE